MQSSCGPAPSFLLGKHQEVGVLGPVLRARLGNSQAALQTHQCPQLSPRAHRHAVLSASALSVTPERLV